MLNRGKFPILGVYVDAVDYEAVVARVVEAAQARRPLSVSALAVHGVMTGALDREQRYRLNSLNLLVPDGQPVRWALNVLHKTHLYDRVYGPTLMLEVCRAAAEHGLGIYLYGSRQSVIDQLGRNLEAKYPGLAICGSSPSRFHRLDDDERAQVVASIRSSGASLVFVGLGCPRQETWAYELTSELSIPALCVGAAFDFHAGNLPQAPPVLQKLGLEWVFRLTNEPRRLWRRYLLLNPLFTILVVLQALHLFTLKPGSGRPPTVHTLPG